MMTGCKKQQPRRAHRSRAGRGRGDPPGGGNPSGAVSGHNISQLASRARLPKRRLSWRAFNIKNRQADLFNIDRGGLELQEWEFTVFDLG